MSPSSLLSILSLAFTLTFTSSTACASPINPLTSSPQQSWSLTLYEDTDCTGRQVTKSSAGTFSLIDASTFDGGDWGAAKVTLASNCLVTSYWAPLGGDGKPPNVGMRLQFAAMGGDEKGKGEECLAPDLKQKFNEAAPPPKIGGLYVCCADDEEGLKSQCGEQEVDRYLNGPSPLGDKEAPPE